MVFGAIVFAGRAGLAAVFDQFSHSPGINLNTEKSYGYPYGTIPRLLLFWMTTEATRTKSRRLELGNSLAALTIYQFSAMGC